MTRIKLCPVLAFPNLRPDKAQALKVVEEAAETFSAWEDGIRYRFASTPMGDAAREALASEVADVIQACCNLAAALGITDMTPYLAACEERNRKRGRYDKEQPCK